MKSRYALKVRKSWFMKLYKTFGSLIAGK
jgi:hypothetical protein